MGGGWSLGGLLALYPLTPPPAYASPDLLPDNAPNWGPKGLLGRVSGGPLKPSDHLYFRTHVKKNENFRKSFWMFSKKLFFTKKKQKKMQDINIISLDEKLIICLKSICMYIISNC